MTQPRMYRFRPIRSLHYQQGFSLLELLIAVILIGFLVLVLSQSLLSTIRSNMKAEVKKEVKETGDYALQYVGRIIRNGKTAYYGAVECKNGVTQDGSAIRVVDSDGVSTDISCTTGPGSKLTVNGKQITSQSVELSDCHFLCTSQAYAPSAVAVYMTLQQKGTTTNPYESGSQFFVSTFTMRNK